MAKLLLPAGSISTIDEIIVLDSSKTDGSRLAGLLFNSASLVGHYKREGQTDYTAATLVDITTLGTFDATNNNEIGFKQSPAKTGSYEIHIANNILATGVDWVSIILEGASNMAPVHIQYQTNAVLSSDVATSVHERQMTEAYTTDGDAPTLEEMQFMKWSWLAERVKVGTTLTCKKIDGSTTSMTFTLDDSVRPTSITRAT